MDDLRLARIAARQCGAFTTEQLGACGLGRSGIHSRVAKGQLFRIGRAVYTGSPYHDAWTLRWAAVLSVRSDAATLSHGSAAAIHQLWRRESGRRHVTVPTTHRSRVGEIHVHRTRTLLPTDVVVVRGLRVTSPARTVLDAAARATDDAVHRMIREGEYLGLLPVGEMLRVVESHPGHPGVPRVRRVDPVTAEAALDQTPLEDDLDDLLRSLPLPPPEPQIWVKGASGARYRFDFGWRDMRLAAEADSRSAHARASALESDRFRDNDLAAVGWLTMRFTPLQLADGRRASGQQLLATALQRGWQP